MNKNLNKQFQNSEIKMLVSTKKVLDLIISNLTRKPIQQEMPQNTHTHTHTQHTHTHTPE